MKWSLLELRKYQETPLTFKETINIKESLMKRDNLILDVAPVEVEGLISVERKDYLVHYTVQTTVTVPSTRSLQPVDLSLSFSVDEVFMTAEQYQTRDDLSADEILIIEGNQIDLIRSVEDNILLAIPMQVLTEEEQEAVDLPKGEDWEVLSEEEYQRRKAEEAETKIDPRLAKLSQLLQENSEDEDKE
ncbi:putative ACR [Enterococcus faecalis 13-SD-W-01]|nr:putative ACR [Enterococcus faecalis 13-SD-W-01]